jgi:hypothetical protein
MSNKFAQPNIVLIMADLGWHIGCALEPKSIQLMITMAHKPIAQEFLSDLSE